MSYVEGSTVTSPPRTSPKRVAVAQVIGTTIEWYDFFIYGTASALVFNAVFFPQMSPLLGTMAAFITFAVGFIARPLGAIIFGHIGDRRGRKKTLVVTLLWMGTATLLIGLLPSYDQIGYLAPALLLLLRLAQGIGAGGEWGGAALVGIEHAPRRTKTLFGSFAQMGSPFGLILATAVFLAVGSLGADALHAWGWRVPFLASAILIPVGLVIRMRITEPQEFLESKAQERQGSPLLQTLRGHWRAVLAGTGAFAGTFAFYYLMTTFILVYATNTLKLSSSMSLPINMLAASSEGAFIIIGALLSLRYTGRSIAVTSAFGLVLWAFPGFLLVQTATPALIYLGVAVALAFTGCSYGVLAAEAAKAFPPEVRYTGSSLTYHLGAVVGGGLCPIVATWLLDEVGSIWPVALLGAVAAVVMVMCCLHFKEAPAGAPQRRFLAS